jgi:hypothetical protein
MKAKFLGYDIRITYDDYNTHKVLIQDLNTLEDIKECYNILFELVNLNKDNDS